jgi:hypothetical protein
MLKIVYQVAIAAVGIRTIVMVHLKSLIMGALWCIVETTIWHTC